MVGKMREAGLKWFNLNMWSRDVWMNQWGGAKGQLYNVRGEAEVDQKVILRKVVEQNMMQLQIIEYMTLDRRV